MQLLDLTLATPAENLALDEALLEMPCLGKGYLRIWEATDYSVVLGRSSRVDDEADRAVCDELGIPILRRVSGGATIVTGPGCLMYAVVAPASVLFGDQETDAGDMPESLNPDGLSIDIDAVHRYVLQRMVAALSPIAPQVTQAGTSDLAVLQGSQETLNKDSRLDKFSGNSVRVRRDRFLYHGTLLYDFDLSLIARVLKTAPRQPDYRQQRGHEAFVANLKVTRQDLIDALVKGWQATKTKTDYPADAVSTLVAEKYSRDDWSFQR